MWESRLSGSVRGRRATEGMEKILWHRRESRRKTEKTNIFLQPREAPAYSKSIYCLPYYAYRNVRVHGELRRQEVWVDKLVDLDRKKGGRAKTTWDWANDDFWKSK